MPKNDPWWSAKISSFIGFLILLVSGIILFPPNLITPIVVVVVLFSFLAFIFLNLLFLDDWLEKKHKKTLLFGFGTLITVTVIIATSWLLGMAFKLVKFDDSVIVFIKIISIIFFLYLTEVIVSVHCAKKGAKDRVATEYLYTRQVKSILRGKHGDFNLGYRFVTVYERKNGEPPDVNLVVSAVEKLFEILDNLNLDRYTRELLLDDTKKSLSIDPQIFISGHNPVFYTGRINDLTITKIQ